MIVTLQPSTKGPTCCYASNQQTLSCSAHLSDCTYLGFFCAGPVHLSHLSCLNSDGVVGQALDARSKHILTSLKKRQSIGLLQLRHGVYPRIAGQIRAHMCANLVSSLVDDVSKRGGSTFEGMRDTKEELVAKDPSRRGLPPEWSRVPTIYPYGPGEAFQRKSIRGAV